MLDQKEILLSIIRSLIVIFTALGLGLLLTIFDRRVRGITSYNKIRTGIVELFADYIKLIFKERVVSSTAKVYGIIFAPISVLIMSLLPLAAIPFCYNVIVNEETFSVELYNGEYGLVYCFFSLALYPYLISLIGFIFRDNKNALKSYRIMSHVLLDDVLIILSMIGVVLAFKSLSIQEIVREQGSMIFSQLPSWGIFVQPVGAIVFLVAIISKCEREPFDYSSFPAEVGGKLASSFSGSNFLIISMANKFFMVSCSMVFASLYLGGYNLLPGLDSLAATSPKLIYFLQGFSLIIKSIVVLMLVSSISGSRLQYYKSVVMNWIIVVPVGVINLIITVILIYHFGNSWP